MKPNFGTSPTPLHRSSNDSSVMSPNRSPSKLFGRALGLGMLLLGNVVVQLPYAPVLAAEACTFMRSGSEGDSVKALQKTLNDNGFGAGTVDGIFGQQTEIALLLFQRTNDLDVDGEVGPATCAALIALDQTEFTTVVATSTPSETTTPPAATGSASSTNNQTLVLGNQGTEVTVLQNALRSRGYTSLQATGIYDEQTENTVKRFQFTEGLPVTGQADPTTKARLGSYLSGGGVASTVPPTQVTVPEPPDVEFNAPVTPTTPSQIAMTNNGGDDLSYQVVVPVRGNDSLLATVRTVVSSATLDRTRLGTFVNAGSFAHRYQAESLSYALKARGLDARVVHK